MSADPLKLIAKHVDVAQVEKFTDRVKKYKDQSYASNPPTSSYPAAGHRPSFSVNPPATVPATATYAYTNSWPSTNSTSPYQHAATPSSYQYECVTNLYTNPSAVNVPVEGSHTNISAPSDGVLNDPSLAPIAPQFIAVAPTSLYLKEKKISFTGDDAKIKDADGNTVFRVSSMLLTLSQRRQISDSRGRVLGQLRKKRMPTLQPTVYIGTLEDEKKVKIKAVGILNPFNCNAKIYIGGRTVGRISGNWRAKKFSVVMGGSEVATVSRKTTAASLFLGADSYCLNIQPGVDKVFLSLVVIALDELYHDKDE